MTCDDLDTRLEAVADGTAWTMAESAHVSTCLRCRSRFALAQAIDRLLPTLPVASPPASFTADVMARVRRDRWRAEQALDTGFNVAIAAGLILIAGGVAGLAWTSGLVVVGADMAGLVREAVSLAGERITPQLPVYSMSAGLLALGLVVWWWTESANVEW